MKWNVIFLLSKLQICNHHKKNVCRCVLSDDVAIMQSMEALIELELDVMLLHKIKIIDSATGSLWEETEPAAACEAIVQCIRVKVININ